MKNNEFIFANTINIRKLAKELGIKNINKHTKQELINKIQDILGEGQSDLVQYKVNQERLTLDNVIYYTYLCSLFYNKTIYIGKETDHISQLIEDGVVVVERI